MIRTRLLGKHGVAEGTLALILERPEGFDFRAGQAIDLYIPEMKRMDPLGNSRTLSIASAPSDKELLVAMRIRQTAFKQEISTLEISSELGLDGPYEDFSFWEDESRPSIFLAGGIGITPFRSMVRQEILGGANRQMVLFASNPRPQDIPFREEFAKVAKENDKFKFVPTVTTEGFYPRWEGERGRIKRELILKHVVDPVNADWFAVGPYQFTNAMRELVNEIGGDDDRIKTKEFSGYN